MKKMKFILPIIMLFTQLILAQKKENLTDSQWNYEIECAGISPEGSYMIKVFTYSSKKKLDVLEAKKNAIHGVLFKGFAGNNLTGCATVKPICRSSNIEYEKKDFFDAFFQEGKYLKYVTESSDALASSDRAKVGKNYKIGIVVMVSKDDLRKDLENAGIIKSLKGF